MNLLRSWFRKSVGIGVPTGFFYLSFILSQSRRNVKGKMRNRVWTRFLKLDYKIKKVDPYPITQRKAPRIVVDSKCFFWFSWRLLCTLGDIAVLM